MKMNKEEKKTWRIITFN